MRVDVTNLRGLTRSQRVPATESVLYLTDTKVMEATFQDGQLKTVRGTNAVVEQIEMNCVKVSKGDKTYFLKLGDSVRWLEAERLQ